MSAITSPPESLYTGKQLMEGYRENASHTIADTFTFQQYLAFKPLQSNGQLPGAALTAVGAHDSRVTELLLNFLYDAGSEQTKKVVGFMGGHSQGRSSSEYLDVANLARFLSQAGYVIVTGGGPGMMEAAHLGAHFSGAPDAAWKSVQAALKEVTKDSPADVIPKIALAEIDGKLTIATREDMEKLHAWYKFAGDLHAISDFTPGESLAISTWEYGKEPVMPFATAYACYFQNSIRESHLVRESRAGIIYARGGGGTMREIWQDVEENYYVEKREALTPMIFFDQAAIWGDLTSNGTKPLDIYSTIMRVLHYRLGNKGFSWEDKIVATTNPHKILDLLDKHVDSSRRKVQAIAAAVAMSAQ